MERVGHHEGSIVESLQPTLHGRLHLLIVGQILVFQISAVGIMHVQLQSVGNPVQHFRLAIRGIQDIDKQQSG